MPMRDDDLRSASFLDSTRFPNMVFGHADITGEGDRVALVGDLTIRDLTRRVTIDVEFLGFDETGLQGEPRIGFSGARRCAVPTSRWWPSAEGSKIIVGDVVTIELDVEAFLER